MPRNGSGTYQKTMTAQPSTTISSSAFNTQIDDIATALTGSIPRDGQAGPTADIPAGGNKFTSVGNAALRNQFAAAGQVQDGAFLWAGTAGGTADALTANLSPAITAYTAGLAVRLLVTATNTGAATLALNGLSAVTLALPDGTNLAGGEIIPGILECVYDGAKFRCTAGVSYISQALYDLLHPVNGPIQIRYDTTNPNSTLPTGVSATWTQITDTDAYLRINSGGTPGATGGADSSSGALPNHVHSRGSLTNSGPTSTDPYTFNPGGQPAGDGNHSHNISGNTGNPTSNPSVTVSVRPKYRDFRAWRRTA